MWAGSGGDPGLEAPLRASGRHGARRMGSKAGRWAAWHARAAQVPGESHSGTAEQMRSSARLPASTRTCCAPSPRADRDTGPSGQQPRRTPPATPARWRPARGVGSSRDWCSREGASTQGGAARGYGRGACMAGYPLSCGRRPGRVQAEQHQRRAWRPVRQPPCQGHPPSGAGCGSRGCTAPRAASAPTQTARSGTADGS